MISPRSKWFSKYSDDSSSTDVEDSSDSESVECDGLQKWLKKDGRHKEDNDTNKKQFKSHLEKNKNKCSEICIFFCKEIDEIKWKDAYDNLMVIYKIINKGNYNDIQDATNLILDTINTKILIHSNKYKKDISFMKFYKLYMKIREDIEFISDLIIKNNNRSTSSSQVTWTDEQILQNRLHDAKTITELEVISDESISYPRIFFPCISLLLNEHILQTPSYTNLRNCYDTFDKILSPSSIPLMDYDVKHVKGFNPIILPIVIKISVELLYYKYIRLLQNVDPNGPIYNIILSDEKRLLSILFKIVSFYEKYPSRKSSIIIYIASLTYTQKNTIIPKYYKFIENNATPEEIIMFRLYNKFNLLVNDKLIHEDSHIGYSIEACILHNRILCKMGENTFLQGDIDKTFIHLHEILHTPNIPILLGQIPLNGNESVLIPFHCHFNIEKMMEMYLISCILINPVKISKIYSAIMFKYDRETIMGEPTTMYEKIYTSSKLLLEGKWKQSYEIIKSLKYYKSYNHDTHVYIHEIFKDIGVEKYIKYSSEKYINIKVKDILIEQDISYNILCSIVKNMSNIKIDGEYLIYF